MKKILLHIGVPKTGTSAVQLFLMANYRRLASCGVIVPSVDLSYDSEVEGHQVWFFEESISDLDSAREKVRAYIENLETLNQGEFKQIIFSAENLSNLIEWWRLFKGLEETYEISIVVYLRRQDDYLLSAWQQWYSKVEKDFWAWLIKESGVMADWKKTIENWIPFIPYSNINVRIYERHRLIGNDVVKDFCQYIEADTSTFEFPVRIVNPSFTQAALDFVMASNILAESAHDNAFYDLIYELTGNNYFKEPKESMLTFEQRMAILSKYKRSNGWVFDNYVRHKWDCCELFTPLSLDDYIVPSKEEVDRRKMSLLMDLIYGLNKKIEGFSR